MNSEYYSLWNLRRVIFQQFIDSKSEEEMKPLFDSELKFMEQLIPKSSKSYWIWFHREWVTSRLKNCDWMRELKLCGKLLEADERNFHCWNYRRYAAKMASTTLKDELDFTTKKIEQNFSNYSAWHQRSALIPLIYNNKNDLKKVLNQEFELIQNAMYTEPADQSVWFYHQWLIQKFMESSTVEETKCCFGKRT